MERASLFNQAANVWIGDEPSGSEVSEAVESLLPYYPMSNPPALLYSVTDVSALRELVGKYADSVNPDASSGYPMMRLAGKKGDLLKAHKDFVVECVCRRVMLYAQEDTKLYDLDPRELVMNGFVDPVAVFVKKEPHEVRKIGGRERLIASVSVVDELIARMLFSSQNRAEIQHWFECPSKPGIGFTDDMMLKVCKWIKTQYAEGTVLADSDVSAWDFSVKEWQFVADALRRTLMINWRGDDSAKKLFQRMASAHHYCMTHSVFVLGDGTLYEQLGGGWMKSGSYVTSSTNSFCRVLLSTLAGASPGRSIAMGDDCIEEVSENAGKRCRELGFQLKQYNLSEKGEELEFCCHRFSASGRIERLKIEKSLFALLHKSWSVEAEEQFRWEFRHSAQLGLALEALSRCGWLPANGA